MSLSTLPAVSDAHVEALRARLNSPETQWVERKVKGDDKVIRKALVAFANSVRDGEWAVLFLGASDNGEHPGVRNADEIQHDVTDLAQNHCYPAIPIRPVVFSTVVRGSSVTVVAIEIPASANRPHFAGQSFVRIGSSSVPASVAQFEELIASRQEVVRRLQQISRDAIFRVRSESGLWFEFNGAFTRPTNNEALKIDIYGSGGRHRLVRLSEVEILSTSGPKPLLQIPPTGTEPEHILEMLNAWRAKQGPVFHINANNEILRQLIHRAPDVCIFMAQHGWADAANAQERTLFEFFNLHERRFR